MSTAIHHNIFDQQNKDLYFSDLLQMQLWVENNLVQHVIFFFFAERRGQK